MVAETKPENPPAFPGNVDLSAVDVVDSSGMTLRDYFAAKAMQGALSNLDVFDAITRVGRTDGAERVEAMALFAYDMADAMLAERSK